MNTDDQIFVQNFITCTKLKWSLILELNFAQRYKIGIDWDMHWTLFLRCEGKKIASSLKVTKPGKWTTAFLETPSGKTTRDRSEITFNDLPLYYTIILLYHTTVVDFFLHILSQFLLAILIRVMGLSTGGKFVLSA